MVVIEERQIEIESARKQLEAAAGVGRAVVEQPRPDAVGDARREPLDGAVAPFLAHAGDHQPRVRRRSRQLPEPRNVRWVVLTVAVECRDPWTSRGFDAGANGRALARATDMAQ